jgi:hypothetical protein
VVDESTYPTQEGFVSEEPANESLSTMMEQEIARVVGEWRAGIGVFSSTSTSGPSIVTEMEHDLAQYLAECEEKACAFCDEQPCVWFSNHDSMPAWDELEHSNLPEEDVPTANIRRNKFYSQMAITMNRGPVGKGLRIQHPKYVIDGIRTISPDPDGNCMCYKND